MEEYNSAVQTQEEIPMLANAMPENRKINFTKFSDEERKYQDNPYK